MAVELLRRKFTVTEYHQMGESGVLGADDRVELINGEVIERSPIGMRHAACVNRLSNLFPVLFGNRAIMTVQNPVQFNDDVDRKFRRGGD